MNAKMRLYNNILQGAIQYLLIIALIILFHVQKPKLSCLLRNNK